MKVEFIDLKCPNVALHRPALPTQGPESDGRLNSKLNISQCQSIGFKYTPHNKKGENIVYCSKVCHFNRKINPSRNKHQKLY